MPKLTTLRTVDSSSSDRSYTFYQPRHIILQGTSFFSLSLSDMPQLSNVYLANRFAYKSDVQKSSLLHSPPFTPRYWSPLKLHFTSFLHTLTQFPSSSTHPSFPPLMDVSHAKNDRYVRIEALRRQYKTCFKKLLLNLKVFTNTSSSLHRLTKTGEAQHPTRTYGN